MLQNGSGLDPNSELVERDLVLDGGEAGEVRAHDDAVHVAGEQERRVAEVAGVLEELVEGGVEVLVLLLVFSGELAFFPDVGEPATAAGLLDAALEGVPRARGVGVGRLGVVEDFAEVEVVLLRGRSLGQLSFLPDFDELGGVHDESAPVRGWRGDAPSVARRGSQ